jgi:hypothetical protein
LRSPYVNYCTPIINACQVELSWYSIVMRDKNSKIAMFLKRLLEAVKEVRKAIQGQTSTIAKGAKTTNAKQCTPPLVRAEVDLPKGVEIHKTASDATDDRKYQFRTLLLSSLTLLALVIYSIISFCQWREMRKATEATWRSIKDNEAAQAAHLVIQAFEVNVIPGTGSALNVEVDYSILNAGQSVATEIGIQSGGGSCNLLISKCTQHQIELIPHTAPFGPSLPAGQKLTGTFGAGTNKEDVINGYSTFTADMTVSYKDIFGKSYAIYGCSSYNTDKRRFDSTHCSQGIQPKSGENQNP